LFNQEVRKSTAFFSEVYYESIKRDPKIRGINNGVVLFIYYYFLFFFFLLVSNMPEVIDLVSSEDEMDKDEMDKRKRKEVGKFVDVGSTPSSHQVFSMPCRMVVRPPSPTSLSFALPRRPSPPQL
jgi:hypothetical protein